MKWTDEQIACIDLAISDAEIARRASLVGPPRSASAAEKKRADMGLFRRQDRIELGRQAYAAAQIKRQGWPVLVGSDEERDRRYVIRLLEHGLRLKLARAA